VFQFGVIFQPPDGPRILQNGEQTLALDFTGRDTGQKRAASAFTHQLVDVCDEGAWQYYVDSPGF
jgi:hypothetical protein